MFSQKQPKIQNNHELHSAQEWNLKGTRLQSNTPIVEKFVGQVPFSIPHQESNILPSHIKILIRPDATSFFQLQRRNFIEAIQIGFICAEKLHIPLTQILIYKYTTLEEPNVVEYIIIFYCSTISPEQSIELHLAIADSLNSWMDESPSLSKAFFMNKISVQVNPLEFFHDI